MATPHSSKGSLISHDDDPSANCPDEEALLQYALIVSTDSRIKTPPRVICRT